MHFHRRTAGRTAGWRENHVARAPGTAGVPSAGDSFFGTALRRTVQPRLSKRCALQNASVCAGGVWRRSHLSAASPSTRSAQLFLLPRFSSKAPRSAGARRRRPATATPLRSGAATAPATGVCEQPPDPSSVAFSKQSSAKSHVHVHTYLHTHLHTHLHTCTPWRGQGKADGGRPVCSAELSPSARQTPCSRVPGAHGEPPA